MTIQGRCTIVGSLFLNTVSSSAIVQLGDHASVQLKSRAIAVQRAIPNFEKDEFRFAAYPIFFREAITLTPCRPIQFQSCPSTSNIRIGAVESLGVSAASYLRAGCGGALSAVSRVKHIRHFNNRDIS